MLSATSSNIDAGQLLLGLMGLGLYFLPSIVAAVRKMPNRGSTEVVNLFLGWTVLGWIVALAMASGDPRKHAATDVDMDVVAAGHRPCPWCAEPIRQAAVVCRYCGRDIAPVEPPRRLSRRPDSRVSTFDDPWSRS